jgi:tetratricopeptide (TPR) repeat protein
MFRIPRALIVALALVYGVGTPTAFAQFDFGGSKAKKKPAKGKDAKKKAGKKGDKKDGKDNEDDEGSDPVPLPSSGLDLKKEAPAEAPAKGAEKSDKEKPEAPAKAEKVKAAPAMSFEAVDVSGKSADRQKLDAALNHFKGDNYEQAALSAHTLMRDPKLAALSVESQYLLAKSLYRMGLYHSSLGEFSKILARGPSTRFFKSSLEWLFFISRKTVNEAVVLDEIAKYANFEFPQRFRHEFYYLLARYYFVRGKALDELEQKGEADKSFEEVKRLTLMIPKRDAFYPRGKYLEGLALFRADKAEAALEAFKEVVRETREIAGTVGSEAKAMKALRELAFMQLGRTHYGARQNRYAIFYFGKVERGGAQWLESLFESSWASYRIGKYEQALGNLITLSSPFFREEYFPEALILKAVIYYENCRYREALMVIEDFERIYGPVQEQLELLVAKNMEATEYYRVLAEVKKKNKEGLAQSHTDQILERILNLALTDTDLKKTSDSITELEGEIDTFGNKADNFKFSGLAKDLIEGLKVQREQLIKKAGVMSKGKLEFENGALKALRSNGLRIKFETNDQEKRFLEEVLASGGEAKIVIPYKFSAAVSDDELYWPYFGEYWRDELGTYEYTLTKGCIDPTAYKVSGGQQK